VKNRLSDLYNHLFETLETLKEVKPVAMESEIKRATAIRLTAATVIEAAKLEVSIRKLTKNTPQSAFFSTPDELPNNDPKRLEGGEKSDEQ
jgi:hypothetical protein